MTRRLLLALALLGAAGAVAGRASYSAFATTTSNTGDTSTAGTVVVSDSHTGSTALVGLTSAVPTVNDTSTGCISVTYSGSLTANMSLYVSSLTFTSASSLAPYLTVTVTRGSWNGSAPAYPSCTNFLADTTNWGLGPGVISSGSLSAFRATYAAGLLPTPGAPDSWSSGQSRVYRFAVSLQDNLAARGLNASATFRWEARST